MLLTWLPFAWLIALVGAAGGAIAAWSTVAPALRRLTTLAPAPRTMLLLLIALAPIFAGLTALGVAFTPSVLDALGLVADHCSVHGGHAFHLCFLHGQPPAVSAWWIAAALAVSAGIVLRGAHELLRLRHAHRWSRRLLGVARHDAARGRWLVATDRPLALTTGLLRRRVCVSDGLVHLLTAPQFEAVIAHERAHARRFDGLLKLTVRLAACLHLPGTGARLLEAIDLACEQACDEAAARTVGDPLTVAEAILVVSRANAETNPPTPALSFGASPVEDRVRALVDGQWHAPRWSPLAAAVIALLLAGAAFYEPLHHWVETLLARLV